jgi:hypothetical protein
MFERAAGACSRVQKFKSSILNPGMRVNLKPVDLIEILLAASIQPLFEKEGLGIFLRNLELLNL